MKYYRYVDVYVYNVYTIYINIWYPPKKTYIFSFCTGIYSGFCIFEDLFF